MGKLLELSTEYMQNTSEEEKATDWERLKKFNESGPDMLDILDNINFIISEEQHIKSNNFNKII